MIDIKFIRENKELVRNGAKSKNIEIDVDKILELDSRQRALSTEVQNLRAERNSAAQARDIEKGKEIKGKLDDKEIELKNLDLELNGLLIQIPNLPLKHLPLGDESKNEVIKKEGVVREFGFDVKDHLELGEKLDIIDVVRAAKVSGTRFAYLKNEGALLELALLQYAMETLVNAGFSPVFPPALIRQEMTTGLGYWQAGGNENYYLVSDFDEKEGLGNSNLNPLYLIGTAEHALVPMHKDETFQEKELSKRYAGFSPAFRREAGTYGKDTRGVLRVHQFDKVEMVVFTKPENDREEFQELLQISEKFMQELGLPYQTVQLASGDISFPTAETVDIETWFPSQNKYRETHSISTTTDFQSRRFNIKYQDGDNRKYVHILNGTAFAIGRTIAAILENYQTEDGSVLIPEVLQKYLKTDRISPKK